MAAVPRSSVSDDGVFDAVIVGADLGGVCMLNRWRSRGFSMRVFEVGSGIGGAWFWNRYPGARCDAPSMEYSYQFSEQLQQDWNWSDDEQPVDARTLVRSEATVSLLGG